MPYMVTPESEIPMCYGLRLVVGGELVLVADADVPALVAEGWVPSTLTTNTTAPSAPQEQPAKEEK